MILLPILKNYLKTIQLKVSQSHVGLISFALALFFVISLVVSSMLVVQNQDLRRQARSEGCYDNNHELGGCIQAEACGFDDNGQAKWWCPNISGGGGGGGPAGEPAGNPASDCRCDSASCGEIHDNTDQCRKYECTSAGWRDIGEATHPQCVGGGGVETPVENVCSPTKIDLDGACNPACCGNDLECPANEACTVSNGYCSSGTSCGPKAATAPQTGGAAPTDPSSGDQSATANYACSVAGGTCLSSNLCQAEGGTVVNDYTCSNSNSVCCTFGEKQQTNSGFGVDACNAGEQFCTGDETLWTCKYQDELKARRWVSTKCEHGCSNNSCQPPSTSNNTSSTTGQSNQSQAQSGAHANKPSQENTPPTGTKESKEGATVGTKNNTIPDQQTEPTVGKSNPPQQDVAQTAGQQSAENSQSVPPTNTQSAEGATGGKPLLQQVRPPTLYDPCYLPGKLSCIGGLYHRCVNGQQQPLSDLDVCQSEPSTKPASASVDHVPETQICSQYGGECVKDGVVPSACESLYPYACPENFTCVVRRPVCNAANPNPTPAPTSAGSGSSSTSAAPKGAPPTTGIVKPPEGSINLAFEAGRFAEFAEQSATALVVCRNQSPPKTEQALADCYCAQVEGGCLPGSVASKVAQNLAQSTSNNSNLECVEFVCSLSSALTNSICSCSVDLAKNLNSSCVESGAVGGYNFCQNLRSDTFQFRPGDIVVFGANSASGPGHIGICNTNTAENGPCYLAEANYDTLDGSCDEGQGCINVGRPIDKQLPLGVWRTTSCHN